MSTEEACNLIVKDSLITNANLLALTDASETALHSHAGGGSGDTYTSKGDVAAYDFDIGDAEITDDDTWRTLDLSGIVPAGTKLILVQLTVQADAANRFCAIRKNGYSNSRNVFDFVTHGTHVHRVSGWVECDANRVVEYYIVSQYTVWSITVKGYTT